MELFKLLGLIAIDNSNAISEIDETVEKAEKSEGKIGNAFAKIGKAAVKVGAAVGAAAVTAGAAITKAAVSNYADYEQLVGGVETLFKDSADKVKKYAENAYMTAGLSANDYMETVTSFSASLIQSLSGNTKEAAEYANMAIVDMSDNANKMGTDMASIQNAYQGFAKQNYTMLDNLKLGYGGTKEEMQRLLNKANELNAVQGKHTNYQIESYADIVEAIHVVQTELGITGTTQAEAFETISGSFAMVKASWNNLLTGFADGEQDLEGLFEEFSTSVGQLSSNLLPRIKTTVERLITFVWKKLKEELPNMGTKVVKLLEDTIGINLPNLAKKGTEMVHNLADGIREKTPEFISKGLELLLSFSEFLLENMPTIAAAGMDLLRNLIKGIMDSLPELIAKIPQIVSNIANTFSGFATILMTSGIKILGDITIGLVKAIPALIANIPKIIKMILDIWNAINWLNLGKNLVNGIKNGIASVWGSLTGQAKNLFKNLEDVSWKAFLKIKEVITSPILTTKTKVLALLGELKAGVSTLLQPLKGIVSKIFEGVKTAITNPISTAKDIIKKIIDTIKGFFSGFKISIPKIPLPHFSVKPSDWEIGDLLKGKIPKLGISWYAKGAVFDSPTLLPTATGIKGVGEAGAEAVAPITVLQSYVADAVRDENVAMISKIDQLIALLQLYLPYLAKNRDVLLNTGELVGALAPQLDYSLGRIAAGKERGR